MRISEAVGTFFGATHLVHQLLVLLPLKNKFNLIKQQLITGNTLNEISHHPAKMGSDVFQHVQLLLVLSL